jgi:hypothetical protein
MDDSKKSATSQLPPIYTEIKNIERDARCDYQCDYGCDYPVGKSVAKNDALATHGDAFTREVCDASATHKAGDASEPIYKE